MYSKYAADELLHDENILKVMVTKDCELHVCFFSLDLTWLRIEKHGVCITQLISTKGFKIGKLLQKLGYDFYQSSHQSVTF